jgi:LysM repeat protein
MAFYTVQDGDTLGGIAEAFDTTVDTLQDVNAIPDPDVIFAGQILCIPAWGTYTVQAGDTLSGIAQTFGTTVDALFAANCHVTRNPNFIQVGQTLAVPQA